MENSVTVRQPDDGEICVVDLQGEIDVFASPQVKSSLVELAKNGRTLIVADFGKVSYIDSTGLGALVAALKAARERDGTIAIVCVNPQIRRIFDITGLVKIFGLFDDVDSARADLRARYVAGHSR